MGTNFWELLHQRQDQLTRSGHAVADYLLQHADEAQYLSISSLARECNVAEACMKPLVHTDIVCRLYFWDSDFWGKNFWNMQIQYQQH